MNLWRAAETKPQTPSLAAGLLIHPPPDGFPEVASFTLSSDEARFLRERVVLTHPDSLLAHILQTGKGGDGYSAAYPWAYPTAHAAPPSVRAWLHDASLFSLVHQGAVLLYNLMLARKLGKGDSIAEFSAGLDTWTQAIASARLDLGRWNRFSMWKRLLGANPRLRTRTREFADRWYELAATRRGESIGNSTEAQRLIREREHALKGARARLTYAEARDRRKGFPTWAPLKFRWTQVQRITSDIMSALEQR